MTGLGVEGQGNVLNVAALSDGLFDEIEFEAARTGDHRRAALRMNHLAATAAEARDMSRAEAYLRAGEQWMLADEPAVAAAGFRLAMADGGPTFADPRVPLARALLALGLREEADELIRQLDADGAAGKCDPRTCDLAAELFAEQGNMTGALRWATTGADECMRRGDRAELRLLLRLRYRIRNDLGLAEDDYDRVLDQLTDDARAPGGAAADEGPDGPAGSRKQRGRLRLAGDHEGCADA